MPYAFKCCFHYKEEREEKDTMAVRHNWAQLGMERKKKEKKDKFLFRKLVLEQSGTPSVPEVLFNRNNNGHYFYYLPAPKRK